jgi:hypothetical protein
MNATEMLYLTTFPYMPISGPVLLLVSSELVSDTHRSQIQITQLDKRGQAGGIFYDLTKAFNCVNHGILLNKVHYYGIRGVCYAWFESYLANRKQKVCLLSNSSEDVLSSNWEMIVSGVPQGSILGPMLFILYSFHDRMVLCKWISIKYGKNKYNEIYSQ